MLSYFLLPNADVSQLWYLSFLMLYELSLNFHDICFVGLCVEVASKSNHFNSRLKKEDLKFNFIKARKRNNIFKAQELMKQKRLPFRPY